MKVRKKNKSLFLMLYVILVSCLFSSIIGIVPKSVYAENTGYSNVLEDLQKDENFKIEDYSVNNEDYSLKVIQIAESTGGELFVYVYQPCTTKDLKATTISISTSINENFSPKLYNLKFLNSNGVFCKYKVDDLKVKEDVVRYYEIVSIFRKWIENVDDAPIGDNTINEVSYEVRQKWTACTLNNSVSYNCEETKVVTITEKYVGFVRISNGAFWSVSGSCDSHFIAFDTDYKIDELIEADVYFVSTPICAYWRLIGNTWGYVNNDVYGVSSEHYVYIKEKDNMTNHPSWLGGNKYVRDRIQSIDEFLKSEEISEENKKNFENKKWVLRFFESSYYDKGDYYYWTEVNDVSILRLKFKTGKDIYNLGVVDNKQSGDKEPVNPQESWWEKLIKLLSAIISSILLLIVVILLCIFTPFLKVIWKIISCLAKGIWWVISAPFSLFLDD